jgi:hypothetical protein
VKERVRDFIHGEIAYAREKNNEWLRSLGCPEEGMRKGILDYEHRAIELFLGTLGSDDDSAIDAAGGLFHALPDATRGVVTTYLIYHDLLSPRPFAGLLSRAWERGRTGSVLALAAPQGFIVRAFKKARSEAPDVLMGEAWPHYQALPGIVTIYRGIRNHRAARGMAWSTNRTAARRFAGAGWGRDTGRLLAAEISKRHALALLDPPNEGESELVCNPRALRNVRVVEDNFPEIAFADEFAGMEAA